MNQYDFDPSQISQNTTPTQIPSRIPQSLNHSGQVSPNIQKSIHEALKSNMPSITELDTSLLNLKQNVNRPQNIEQDFSGTCTTGITGKSATSFENFLEKQKMYGLRAQDRIKRVKENIQSLAGVDTFQPQISKKSKMYSMNKNNNQNVFERLSKNQKPNPKNPHQQNLFQPNISQKSKKMVRKQPVGEYLYKDASLRKQKHSQNVTKKQQSQTIPFKINTYNSVKNQELVGRRLFKEFYRVARNLGIDIGKNQILRKEVFVGVLGEMGFLGSVVVAMGEVSLIEAAYQEFLNTQQNCLSLFGFLLVVMGVQQTEIPKYINHQTAGINSYKSKSQSEIKVLHNRFHSLYSNRLSSEQKEFKNFETPQCMYSFKPQLTKQTQLLAQKNRKQKLSMVTSKLISQKSSKQNSPLCKVITHPQYLLLNRKLQEIQMFERRKLEDKRIMDQCTFYPKVSKFQVKKIRKSIIEQQPEYKPQQFDIGKGNSQANNGNNADSQNNNNQVRVSEKVSFGVSNPIMILDVDFGGKQDQIYVRVEDGDNLEQISKYFADKHMMDEESQAQLLQMLKSQYQQFHGQPDNLNITNEQ